jgi:hypothetical protein
MGTARQGMASRRMQQYSSIAAFGGYTNPSTLTSNTELWNGTSWSEVQ